MSLEKLKWEKKWNPEKKPMILLEMTSHQFFFFFFRFKYFNALRNMYGTAHARFYCLFEIYGFEM